MAHGRRTSGVPRVKTEGNEGSKGLRPLASLPSVSFVNFLRPDGKTQGVAASPPGINIEQRSARSTTHAPIRLRRTTGAATANCETEFRRTRPFPNRVWEREGNEGPPSNLS